MLKLQLCSLLVLRKCCGAEHGNLARKPAEVPRNEQNPFDNTKSRQNLSKTVVLEVLRKYRRKCAKTSLWYKRIMSNIVK